MSYSLSLGPLMAAGVQTLTPGPQKFSVAKRALPYPEQKDLSSEARTPQSSVSVSLSLSRVYPKIEVPCPCPVSKKKGVPRTSRYKRCPERCPEWTSVFFLTKNFVPFFGVPRGFRVFRDQKVSQKKGVPKVSKLVSKEVPGHPKTKLGRVSC